MPSLDDIKDDILRNTQYSVFYDRDPVHPTGGPRKVITYQYAGTSRPGDLPTTTSYSGWTDFSQANKDAFRAQLDHIETFLNVSFREVWNSSDPDINVGKVYLPGSTTGVGGVAVGLLGDRIYSVDSFVLYDNLYNLANWPNLILHELGHALGLKHPFDAPVVLPKMYDSTKYTVMSYTPNPDNGVDSDAMMLHDIIALQNIWGSVDYNTGNNTYTGSRTNTIDAIWDTGGKDTFKALRKHDVTIDLREAKFSSFDAKDDVVIAYGTRIENAKTGKGHDHITGNELKNKLVGNNGADTILGGENADWIRGGGGRDLLDGQKGRDRLFGEGGNDTLRGGGGNDTLAGGTGRDKMNGGTGADRFVFAFGDERDLVADFQPGVDVIEFVGLGTEAEIRALARQVDHFVVFDFGGGDVLRVFDATVADVINGILVL